MMPPVLMTVSAPVTSVTGLLESAYSENSEVVTHCETDSPGQGWEVSAGRLGVKGVAGCGVCVCVLGAPRVPPIRS